MTVHEFSMFNKTPSNPQTGPMRLSTASMIDTPTEIKKASPRTTRPTGLPRWMLAGVVMVWLCGGPIIPVNSQEVADQIGVIDDIRPIAVAGVAEFHSVPDGIGGESGSDSARNYENGAPLKTDPELEELLKRASLFAQERSYRNATLIWQKVLSESNDTLVSRDGETYYSLAREVERTIAQLPPEGLQIYRISADGEAQAILAEAGEAGNERALERIVQNYFLSSNGDEAAFELGCLALDRYDFVTANRLFTKILREYPNSTVPRDQILLRLAVAAAQVGDQALASESLESLDGSETIDPVAIRIVREQFDKIEYGSGDAKIGGKNDWVMRFGSSSRRGVMPRLPEVAIAEKLTKQWEFAFPLQFSLGPQQVGYGVRRIVKTDSSTDSANEAEKDFVLTSQEKSLAGKWVRNGWRPAGDLLIWDDRIYMKTNTDLTCWDANSLSEQPVWRSVWANEYHPDDATAAITMMYQAYNQTRSTNYPSQTPEVMLFGDRIHHAMVIDEGVIYSIEGERFSKLQSRRAATQTRQTFQYGVVPRRTRTNWLAAYDAETGKVLWHRSASDTPVAEEDVASDGVGFMAAPVPFGNLLLVPVSESGAVWLYALDKSDRGATKWKSYLCDEPVGGCRPWSPVSVAVEGRDAYVLCGSGVLFSLDAVSGSIHFAKRYQRFGKENMEMRRFGIANGMMYLEGWDEDLVIPYANWLVVLASDHDGIFACDRQTGKELWRAPRHPFGEAATYCIGVQGEQLFVAGHKTVMCYDLAGEGRLSWVHALEKPSFGRGMLTDRGLYIPTQDSIVMLDMKTGEPVQEVSVSLTNGYPVGNLYSDGRKMWVLGMNRVFALTNLQLRLSVLDDRIRENDQVALLERMRLFAKIDRVESAFTDLDRLFRARIKRDGVENAAEFLCQELVELQLPSRQPVRTAALILDYSRDEPGGGSLLLSSRVLQNRADLFDSLLQGLRDNPADSNVATMIELGTLRPDESNILKTQQLLLEVATRKDLAILSEALATGIPAIKRMVIPALLHVGGTEEEQQVAESLDSEDESLVLLAAWQLLDREYRPALPVLLGLFQSDDLITRRLAIKALQQSTGQTFGFSDQVDRPAQDASIAKWKEWLEENQATADLTLPLPSMSVRLGHTLVVFYNNNQVVEYDENHREIWTKQLVGAWACQGLPNGHRLVTTLSGRAVIEFDHQGREVWKVDELPGQPTSVQRLENGNTLVTCSNASRVLEYRPDKEIAWEATLSGTPWHARRLPNGHTLVTLSRSNQIVELDSSGEQVKNLSVNFPYGVRRLPNGNTLACEMNLHQVVEFDPSGARVWTKQGLSMPYDAERLPNGNTIIAHRGGLTEVNKSGDTVWSINRNNHASGVSNF